MRDQRHAKHLAARSAASLDRLGYLYSAAFAAAARMDLGLDHHAGCARAEQILGAASASSRVSAISPRGTATPYFVRIAFPDIHGFSYL